MIRLVVSSNRQLLAARQALLSLSARLANVTSGPRRRSHLKVGECREYRVRAAPLEFGKTISALERGVVMAWVVTPVRLDLPD